VYVLRFYVFSFKIQENGDFLCLFELLDYTGFLEHSTSSRWTQWETAVQHGNVSHHCQLSRRTQYFLCTVYTSCGPSFWPHIHNPHRI